MYKVLPLLLFCFFQTLTQAIAQGVEFRRLGVEEGLPSSKVYHAIQDKNGYIWFATGKGVAKYNGYDFKIFSQTNGLSHSEAWRLFEDSKGRIWVSTFGSSFCYIQNDTVGKIDNLDLNRVQANDFWEDAKGCIWVKMRNRIVVIEDGKAQLFKPKGVAGSINFLGSTYDKSKVFFSTSTEVYEYSIADKSVKKIVDIPNKGIDVLVFKKESSKDDIFLYALDKEIYEFYPNQRLFAKLASASKPTIILPFDKGRKYIVRNARGENAVIDENGQELRDFPLSSESGINDILIDAEGSIWQSTQDEGVYTCPQNGKHVKIHSLVYEGKRLSISAMTFDDKGQLWMGTKDGSVFIFANGEYKPYLTQRLRAPFKPFWVRQMAMTSDGSIHIACEGQNRFYFSENYPLNMPNFEPELSYGKDKKLGIGRAKVSYYTAKSIKAVGNDLWVGTHCSVIRHKESLGSLSLTKMLNDDFQVKNYAVQPDKFDRIWLGTPNGLFFVQNYTLNNLDELKKKYPILQQTITDIVADQESNVLWVGTEAYGLFKVKLEANGITVEEGMLKDAFVNRIFLDTQKRLWVATNNGVYWSRFPNDKKWQRISTAHGLPTNEINDVIEKDDKLYVGTPKGLCVVDYKKLEFVYKPSRLHVTSFDVSGKPLEWSGKEIKLSHTQNDIEIGYVAISHKSKGEINYLYRLEGAETNANWHNTQALQVEFPKLSPGKYLFRIKALDVNGVSSQEQQVAFVIEPAFWDTLLFRVLVLVFVVSGSLAVYWRWNKKRRDKELKQQELAKRFSKIKLTALQEQMNPHFVFNSLNAIQSYIIESIVHIQSKTEAQGSEESTRLLFIANQYLVEFSELIRLFLNASRASYTTIQNECELLSKYVSLEKMRFAGRFDTNIVTEPGLNQQMLIPSVLLQPLVENAINHGFNGINRKGNIQIRFFMENGMLHILVEDDGIGYHQSQLLKRKSESGHKSLGMSIVFERLELLNDVDNLDISYVLTDLGLDSPQRTGTRIKIIMKPKYT